MWNCGSDLGVGAGWYPGPIDCAGVTSTPNSNAPASATSYPIPTALAAAVSSRIPCEVVGVASNLRHPFVGAAVTSYCRHLFGEVRSTDSPTPYLGRDFERWQPWAEGTANRPDDNAARNNPPSSSTKSKQSALTTDFDGRSIVCCRCRLFSSRQARERFCHSNSRSPYADTHPCSSIYLNTTCLIHYLDTTTAIPELPAAKRISIIPHRAIFVLPIKKDESTCQ